MIAAQVLVLAKEPVAGRVKTRLTPSLTGDQAASVASAALEDTLDAVRGTDVAGRLLVVDGVVDAPGFLVLPQAAGPLDARLAAAFDDAWAHQQLPMLLIGMDTPQLTSELLTDALRQLLDPGTDAVLGLAEDGGWWALGLRRPHRDLILGVETSRDDTGARQRQTLVAAGLTLIDLPILRDVDTVTDLAVVAALAPHGRFAGAVSAVLA
jgi:glycosyltransferase A (GT-A) superfamily protein (DUF2064 family)